MVRSRKRDSEDTEMEDATKGREVEEDPEDEGGEQEDDEEAEYEIEAIIDAKNGQFGDVRSAHLSFATWPSICIETYVWCIPLGQTWLPRQMERISGFREQLGQRG